MWLNNKNEWKAQDRETLEPWYTASGKGKWGTSLGRPLVVPWKFTHRITMWLSNLITWYRPKSNENMCVRAQSCLTLCNPIEPGSFVHGIFQARILEWVATSFSRGSSQPRDRTPVSWVSYILRGILYHCVIWEGQWKHTFHENLYINDHSGIIHNGQRHGNNLNVYQQMNG